MECKSCVGSKPLLNEAIISVDQIGVVPWAFFMCCLWFLIYCSYKKVFNMLLRRLALKEHEANHLISLYWAICFTSLSLPFGFGVLRIDPDSFRNKPFELIEKNVQQWMSGRGQNPTVEIKLSYIIFIGFYLNKLCQISIDKGVKNLEFILNELFVLFFASTFALRCVLFGIAVMTLVNSVSCVHAICQLFCSFANVSRSALLKLVSKFIFAIHCFLWCTMFLYILPKCFLQTAVRAVSGEGVEVHKLSSLILMNASFLGYYILEIYASPMAKFILAHLNHSPVRLETLIYDEYDLLVSTHLAHDCTNPEATQPTPGGGEGGDSSPPPPSPGAQDKLSPGEQELRTKQNLRTLYHTVRSYVRIKRKLKRIREQRAAAAASSDAPTDKLKTD